MSCPDPRDAFFKAVDLEKVRIDEFRGFIFLCGGAIPPSSADEPVIGSARHHVWRHLATNYVDLHGRVRLAENVTDWFDPTSLYSNLIEFENDVAELADVVVIFVESPGAIAELGAFCQIDSIARKLLIFVQEEYSKDGSFIDLGPISYLKSLTTRDELVYPWRFDEKNAYDPMSLEDCLDEIAEDVGDFLDATNETAKFDVRSKRHQILLICDILDTCSALTLKEIRGYLTCLGLSIPKDDIERYLFILEKFKFLKVIRRGHNRFYVTVDNPGTLHYRLSSASNVPTDPHRRKIEILQFYESTPAESRRFKAIRQIRVEDSSQ